MRLDAAARHQFLETNLAPLWGAGTAAVLALPMTRVEGAPAEKLPPALTWITLPEWAREWGVDGCIPVPRQACVEAARGWEGVDWLFAAAWYLDAAAERAHEDAHGPIHSYSLRLRGWDPALWTHAWVNRIALFLGRWAERAGGDRPAGRAMPPIDDIVLAHDLDALRKTVAIRIKQGAFHAFNALRHAAGARFGEAAATAARALSFALGQDNLDRLDELADRVRGIGRTATLHVFAGTRRGPLGLLMDPGYALDDALVERLRGLRERGWTIGLHPSFSSWQSAAELGKERERLELALGSPVRACRQHWLRFSWRDTWAAQEAAGLDLDSTLGFNDRAGFRNAAALRFRPWDAAKNGCASLAVVPTVLMDSHLYDYELLGAEERGTRIRQWVAEVRAARGTACINWHPHTLAEDYGWRSGFDTLLQCLK